MLISNLLLVGPAITDTIPMAPAAAVRVLQAAPAVKLQYASVVSMVRNFNAILPAHLPV